MPNSINIPNIVEMHRFCNTFGWLHKNAKWIKDRVAAAAAAAQSCRILHKNRTIFPTQISVANRSDITILYCFVCPFINVQAAAYSIYYMYYICLDAVDMTQLIQSAISSNVQRRLNSLTLHNLLVIAVAQLLAGT